MLRSLQSFLRSSIGKKLVMALTGLLLILFLIGHAVGNLLIYADDDGALFTAYADALESSPLLPLAEIGLIVLFGIHIAMAFRLSLDNREARSQGYAVRSTKGRSQAASGTMIVTGVIVMIFVIIHLIDFRFAKDTADELYPMVVERLGSIGGFLIYFVSMIFLTLHLAHGARSSLQTLGLRHPRWNVVIERGGIALAVVIGLLFASFPLVFFLKGA